MLAAASPVRGRLPGTLAATALLLVAAGPGCTEAESTTPLVESKADPVDTPLHGISADDLSKFRQGDAAFELPLRPVDGLGPLYIRHACSDCHEEGVRGPGLVQKMSVVEADGITPAADQSALAYGHTVRPYVVGEATTPILPPADQTDVKVTVRLGPPIIGRGYMEAVLDSEIERVEKEQSARTDGIQGRIHRVTYQSEANPDPTFNAHQKGDEGLIGRFGLKARIATVDEFTADAFQGDMGITSAMRPAELPNPDGVADDGKTGVDVTMDRVNLTAFYMRTLEIPRRETVEGGAEIFAAARCDVCHVPSLKTRPDYPIALLAGIDSPVFTDFLLHDMGESLADSLPDSDAGGSEWRTSPLIGLRHNRTFLHDGRAKSVEEAILGHAGEAADSLERFEALSADDRDTLLRFVEAL